jgi:riboflavin kinase/FMN adenylyltransferase
MSKASFPPALPMAEQPSHADITRIAIGVFDGVHLGHQTVVRKMLANHGGVAAVVTFEPHPLAVIAPDRVPPRLTTPGQRREILLGMGVGEVVTIEFTEELRDTEPLAFIAALRRMFPRLEWVTIGTDWAFGRGRAGGPELLAKVGASQGFRVETANPVTFDGAIVSSTRVRQAVARGDFPLAARLLGREYEIEGQVVKGDGRGRTLGFPTANLGGVTQVLPPPGVYACLASGNPAVANVGWRPTFGGDPAMSIEAHLLDCRRELYGVPLRLRQFRLLREEIKFSSVEALTAQIAADINIARDIFQAGARPDVHRRTGSAANP